MDYASRTALLKEIRARETTGIAAALDFVVDHPERSAMKLWALYRTLNFRRDHPALFSSGDYIPLAIDGPALAYIRRLKDQWILVLVPLISSEEARSGGFNVRLPAEAPKKWEELFTAELHHTIDDVLGWRGWDRFPVALLVSEGGLQ